jgi:hypothetical protein
MRDEGSAIPLADVLRAANELVSAGLIKDYALGGALAAICFVARHENDVRIVCGNGFCVVVTRIFNRKPGALSATIS